MSCRWSSLWINANGLWDTTYRYTLISVDGLIEFWLWLAKIKLISNVREGNTFNTHTEYAWKRVFVLAAVVIGFVCYFYLYILSIWG